MSEHPVDDLDPTEFDYWTGIVASQLKARGAAVINFEPGDATRYVLAFVFPAKVDGDGHWHVDQRPLWFGSSFGPLYQWNPQWPLDWGYVLDHWLPDDRGNQSNGWTARVLARFLNTLAEKLKSG